MATQFGSESYVGVTEAAAIIGCTTGRVRQMLRDKLIEGKKVTDRAWLICREEAEKLRENAPKTGRPRSGEKK